MKLLDLQYLKEALLTVDLDSGAYSKNDNYTHIMDVLKIIFDFTSISQLISMIYYKRGKKRDLNNIEQRFYKILETLNTLAFEYFKDLQKKYRFSKISYSRENVINFKKSIISLDEEILSNLRTDSYDQRYLPSALNLILDTFRSVQAKDAYDEQGENKKLKLENGRLNDYLSNVFTPFDLILNPRFEYKAREIGDNPQFLNNSLMIEINEIKDDMAVDIKEELKKQFLNQSSLNKNSKAIKDIQLKMKASNVACCMLIWIKSATSLENLRIDFGISELSDYKLKDGEKDVIYNLTKIISYNDEDKSFELAAKGEEQWTGLANGHEIKIDICDFKSVVSAIISHPVILVYQIELKTHNSKYEYNPDSEHVEYADEESKKRYEDDLNYAKELQKQMDEENEPYSWNKNKYKKDEYSNVKLDKAEEIKKSDIKPSESNKHKLNNLDLKQQEVKPPEPKPQEVKLENERQWQCKHCTLINELPNYNCTTCYEKDYDAYNKYFKIDFKKPIHSVNTNIPENKKEPDNDVAFINMSKTQSKSKLNEQLEVRGIPEWDESMKNCIAILRHFEVSECRAEMIEICRNNHCSICLKRVYLKEKICSDCKEKEKINKIANDKKINGISSKSKESNDKPIRMENSSNEKSSFKLSENKEDKVISPSIEISSKSKEDAQSNNEQKEEQKIDRKGLSDILQTRAQTYIVESPKKEVKPFDYKTKDNDKNDADIVQKCMQTFGLAEKKEDAAGKYTEPTKEPLKEKKKVRFEWACKHCKDPIINNSYWNQELSAYCGKCKKKFNPIRYRCVNCLKSYTSKNLIDQHNCE